MTSTTATNVTIPSISDGTSDHRRSVAEIVILSLVVIVILLLSFTGNLLVVVCIRWNRRLRHETGNIFLVNLSITDMTNAAIVMTATLQSLAVDDWLLPMIWCDIVCIMNYVLIIVSMLTLCFIALDRYVAVVYALQYQTMVTQRKVLILISYAWLQGLAFGLTPSLLDWIHYDYWEMVCAIDWGRDSTGTVIYVLFAFTFCFVIPGAVLVACYCKIMKVAKGIASVMPERQTGIFVEPAEIDYSCGTNTNKTSDSNVIESNKERSHGDTVQEGRQQEGTEEEAIEKERCGVSFIENGAAVSMNSVSYTDTQKPEVISRGSQSSNFDPSQGDPSNAKTPSPILYAKICPFRCFGRAVKEEDPSHQLRRTQDGELSHTRRHMPRSSSTKKRQHYSSSTKAIRSLLIVVVAFFVCMTPFCITKVYKVILQDQDALPGSINALATLFQFCSSALNPLIYSIFRKDFRLVFKSWLERMFCRFNPRMSSMDSENFSF